MPLGLDDFPLRRLVSGGMHLLALLLAAGVTVHIARARRIRPPLAMAVVALVAYWLTLMFGRGWEGEPYASALRLHRRGAGRPGGA